MNARPILFSTPMVRAILDGRKTQTRRVIKPQPDGGVQNGVIGPLNGVGNLLVCRLGQPGDRLWVRETFCPIYPQNPNYNGGNPIEYDYAATYKHGDRLGDSIGIKKKWAPSIHMPRAASRITLEITGIRVERLQDISEADARAEGLKGLTKDGNLVKYGIPDSDGLPGSDNTGWDWCDWHADSRQAFRRLWSSINGPDSWAANPWVWVIEFRRIKP
ncbi:hypothetical protein MTYP_01013 [Methylophilaceae bacterium]|nr:hypothetical protein MTYP_01013 [Methylophilaceae bacterium]